MANPTKLKWTGPTAYIDGSTFGAGDLAGFEIQVEGKPAVNVPFGWNTSNSYEYDIKSLNLPFGTYKVAVATVAKNGNVSAPSNQVTFVLSDVRVPNPPKSLTVI